MAWSDPAFSHVHAVRSAVLVGGVGVITTNTSFAAGRPADFLYDDRAALSTKMGATSANQYIQVDRGAGTLAAINCITIPAGHNLNGCTILIQDDDNAGHASPATLLASVAIATTGIYWATFSTPGTQRYLRFTMVTAGTQWEIPELIYGLKFTFASGEAALQEGWGHGYEHTSLTFQKQNGEAPSVQQGPNLRLFAAEWRIVRATAFTDTLALLQAVGDFRPWLYWEPFHQGAADPPVWVKATGQARITADGNRAGGIERLRVNLSMRAWAA